MNNYNEISRVLKCIRLYSKYNQKQLSILLGVSPSYICEIELGKKEPSFTILKNYSKTFDIPISTILLFSENYGNKPNKMIQLMCKKTLSLFEWIYANAKIEQQ